MFTPIQKIIPKAIHSLGIGRQAQAALICEKYRKLAPRLIHSDALLHTFPKYYRGKTLTVGVENPAWAAQVMSQTKTLIAALNAALGKKCIEKIKTQVIIDIPSSSSGKNPY